MVSRLQAEIKQAKPFPRRSSEALLSVLRTAAMLEHRINEILRPHGITEVQFNVLRILRGARPNGLCGREISEQLVSQVPDVSRLLDRKESCSSSAACGTTRTAGMSRPASRPRASAWWTRPRPSSKSSSGGASATSRPRAVADH